MITTNGALFITHIRLLQEAATGLVKTDGTAASSQSVSNSQYLFKTCSKLNTVDSVSSASTGGMVMNLGVGSAEPAASDYYLDETEIDGVDVNTLVTCQSSSNTWNPTALDNGNLAFTYVFRNVGSNAVTVTEMGLSFVCTTGKFLVGRKLIAPRTIQPGETVTFTYELAYC